MRGPHGEEYSHAARERGGCVVGNLRLVDRLEGTMNDSLRAVHRWPVMDHPG